MKINISDFKGWRTCPYAAKVKHEFGRWTPPTDAMRVGTAFHKGLELKLANKPITGLDLEACVSGIEDISDAKTARELLAHLNTFTLPPGRALGSEVKLSTPLYDWDTGDMHTLVGALDGLWEDPDGLLWSLQAKTISSSKPIAHELNRVRLSFHELAYHKLAHDNKRYISGTLVIVGVKLTKKAKEAGQAPIFYEYMPRTWDESEELLPSLEAELLRYAQDMDVDASRASMFRNTDACLGQYGNSPCPLFVHCHQGADLAGVVDTTLTHIREDRYSEID